MKKQLMLGAAMSLALASTLATPAIAQDAADETAVQETVIVTGTRRDARSAQDSPAPVDVVSGVELTNQGDNDLSNLLRTSVPSYNVNTQPISDAATIVRPANLRGLSPDNTLVLLNNKRRHRAAVISFLGGGISDGAQGPDVSAIPAIALKQVEVLRDGASSQYGSDAIAGVINFILKDASEGGSVEAKWGETYESDGAAYQISGNIGLPLGESGFLNLSAEYQETDPTSRSVQRTDAAALIAAGNTDVADPAQIWGQPKISGDFKLFANAGFEIAENHELYSFGNYAEREAEGGFFFRNPTNRGNVYAGPMVDPQTGLVDAADLDGDNVPSVLVGDQTAGGTGNCIDGVPLTQGGLIPDPAFVTAITTADPADSCFSFIELFPGGFTPSFGGNLEDTAFAIGLRGEFALGNGLGYDVSYVYGNNQVDFFINNTINASLGAATPTSFKPGGYGQTENTFNLDFSYGLPVSGFASDLNIAFGYEHREEEFEITAGDPQSYAIGPLALQGFSSSSNGFGGFSPANAGTNKQTNDSYYVDFEADVTEALTLQAAVRYEDYDAFDETTTYKLGGLYRINDNFRIRSTYSTGFHAPTAGQANVSNVTTAFGPNQQLVDQGTLPLNSGAGMFISDFIAGNPGFFAGRSSAPTLGPEESESFTLGAAFDVAGTSVTVDFFNIEVTDRIAISEQLDFQAALVETATQNNIALNGDETTLQLLTALDGAGVLSLADFSGAEDLTTFGFFNNDFDTETQGVDIVATRGLDLVDGGSTNLSLAVNYTDTSVTNVGSLGAGRIKQLEENLPNWRGNLTVTHEQGKWRGLGRVNYYGEFFEDHLDSGGALFFDAGSEITFDGEVGYEIVEGLEMIVGARNLFDSYPDELPTAIGAGGAGAKYPVTAPGGFNGGSYYLKLRYDW